MIEPKAGDAADQRLLDHICRIEAPAQPDLEDAGIGILLAKCEERDRRVHLKQAGADFIIRVEYVAHQLAEATIFDQLASNSNAFVVSDEMWAGERVDALARRFQCGAKEGAGRPLAVGAGNMENWW